MSVAIIAVVVLGFGFASLAVITLARWSDMARWRSSLVAYELHLPASLNVADVATWLSGIQAMTHPMRFSLLPLPPVCLEVVSTTRGISYFVLVASHDVSKLLAGLRGAMPGARITEAPAYMQARPRWQLAAELTMTSYDRPLATERAEQTSTALLASLQPIVGNDTEVRLQYILTSAGTTAPVSTPSVKNNNSGAWNWENTVPQDAEAVQAARAKRRDPQLMAVARVGISAPNAAQAHALFGRIWNNYHGLNNVGVRLRRRMLPSAVVADRLSQRAYPVTRWPLLISSKEGAGLLALPIGEHRLPGLSLGVARQLPPPMNMPSRGALVGMSNYPGMTNHPLALTTTDRLRHMHLMSPTGAGKSTLMARLALADIADGRSVVVLDPKNDLVDAILARIPEHRRDDVVVLNPAATNDKIVGFNPLDVAGEGDYARELVADHVLGIFHSIYREFWGPRTDDILRAALLTLTHTKAPDGTAFTLIEVPELLTNPNLRRYVSTQASLPSHLRQYWQQFDAMSEDARMNAIGSVLNKLRAFTMRTPVRLMLGQSQGVRLDYRFCRKGILLVPLSKGTLGGETANLLGSLLVAALWQTTLGRIRLPADRRPAMFAYLDEFQDVVRLGVGTDLADMLAQARGLGLGLVLAHQYLHQLPEAIQQAVLGTVRTSVAFQCEYADAAVLAKRFAPLTADDLQGLGAYEIAARLCVNGSTLAPVTGMTLPLDVSTGDPNELATSSRTRYGRTRADVEAGLRARIAVNSDSSSVGRHPRRGTT
ncbi:type IV secretory system conjugative DNA transfer family protein [Amycolatopsis sp. H20-H5]|uniref:type IV secretory system conjugative DNA transfer family protein n=1 Tax=Amycolatopsis sp. H20-H5 TaxID=3046309 RepID=UPI002DBC4119|nr:type IV secretory system conjugative DNA transfer family protein [Amycolatopsis sp. H20-H5]MEC3976229.1 type IV secretory system conjugative DNA transfer family protein [Amycolatopsis sp. H20-H5]